MTKTVAVIGAGIVGVATAIWLQRDGHRVILIDKSGPGTGTSHGNAGVLASCSVVPVPGPGLWTKAPRMLFDPEQPLFMRWSYFPKLLPWLLKYMSHANADAARTRARAATPIIGDSLNDHLALSAGTGAEKWVHPGDYCFAYKDRAAYEADAFGFGLRRDEGFEWDVLEGADWTAYDPCYGPSIGTVARFGGHGRITDPGQYVKDLAAHAVAQGARLIIGEVSDIARDNGVVTGVRVGGETIACDACVVSTGVWSGPLAKALGITVPIETERGYHIELWEPSVMPRSPVMIASGKLVVTPMEGRIRVAGIVELGGLEAPPSRAPFALLEKHVRAAIPGLSWKRTVEWMGHRPAIADSLPVIGAAPGVSGAYLGFGHDHVGLTGGPKTGRILSQLISGRTPNIDLAPYAGSRFQ